MQSPVLEFDKICTQNAYFLQKFDFCIFDPKNREVIENSSKTPRNFSSLQYTYSDKYSLQYHKGLVRKKKLKSGYLELRFSVYIAAAMTILVHSLVGHFSYLRI